jgi:hypothetical protein
MATMASGFPPGKRKALASGVRLRKTNRATATELYVKRRAMADSVIFHRKFPASANASNKAVYNKIET